MTAGGPRAMPRYDTVLFDLDGTLLDSIPLIIESFHHTLAAFGVPPVRDEVLLAGVGTPLASQLATWAPDAATTEAMVAAYRAYNLEHHDERVRAYPGVASTIEVLLAKKVRLGVVTSKSGHSARMGLRTMRLEGFMEVMICAEDVKNHKPHREPVDRALELLGASAETTLFVGDSLHDMLAGRAAEVHTGAALWGPFGQAILAEGEPTHWLDSPEDVLALVLD